MALNQSCLSKEEQEEIYDLLVIYRGVFTYRHEIDTCPSIEVDL